MARGKFDKGIAIKQINLRRCAACRKIFPKSEMIRVVKTSSGDISIDTTGKIAGRGSYVCKSAECLQTLQKRRGLDRILKVKVPNEIYDMLKETVLM